MAAVAEMSSADRKKLKVQELRDALGERGLDTTGTKPVLLERLEEAIAAAGTEAEPAAEDKEKQTPKKEDVTPKAKGGAGGGKDAAKSAEKKDEAEMAADSNLEDEPLLEDVPVDEAAKTANDEESELEKRKKRAARFGIELSIQDKVEMRKQRFGSSEKEKSAAATTTTTKMDAPPEPEISEEEKLKRAQRMKRFGLERSGIEELRLQREAKKAYVFHRKSMHAHTHTHIYIYIYRHGIGGTQT